MDITCHMTCNMTWPYDMQRHNILECIIILCTIVSSNDSVLAHVFINCFCSVIVTMFSSLG